jgi:DNA segregation ATPase FtsK/SpoIIIE-like protein
MKRSGPGDHPFRDPAGARHQGQPHQQPGPDLARSLAVISVRVVEVIPGKSVVGIEIPNENRKTGAARRSARVARLRDALESPLALALGYDIAW